MNTMSLFPKRDDDAEAVNILQNTVDPTRRPLGQPNSLNAPVYGQVISEASEQHRSSLKSPLGNATPPKKHNYL